MSQVIGFVWQEEDPHGKFGDGISRPKPGTKVRDYQVIIYQSGERPMRWSCKAESKRHAIRYAQNRWPNAVVELA